MSPLQVGRALLLGALAVGLLVVHAHLKPVYQHCHMAPEGRVCTLTHYQWK